MSDSIPPPPNINPPPPPPPLPPTSAVPPPPYGQPGYGQPGYGQGGYPQPGYAAPGYGTPGFPPSPYGNVALAGFWQRFGGFLLDGLFFWLLLAPFAIVTGILLVQAFDDCYTVDTGRGESELRCPDGALKTGPLAAGIVIGLIGFLIVAFVFMRLLAKRGQTWGRRIAGVKVIRTDNGQPPGWGRAIGRTLFAAFISGQICYLGYLWMLWDSKKQTWHDKVAGTQVIKV